LEKEFIEAGRSWRNFSEALNYDPLNDRLNKRTEGITVRLGPVVNV